MTSRFMHKPIENLLRYDDIDCNYPKGKRHYIVDKDGAKQYYPSVTTVLGADPKKAKSLAAWRKRVGEEAARQISTAASGRGTILHKILEDYLNNETDYLSSRHDANAMFMDLKPYLDKNVDHVISQEVALVSHKLRLAGRVDLIAQWCGQPAIIDFKQSNRPKKIEWVGDYFLQIAAYTAMVYEMVGIEVRKGVIMIGVDGAPPQIFEFDPWSHTRDLYATIQYYRSTIE